MWASFWRSKICEQAFGEERFVSTFFGEVRVDANALFMKESGLDSRQEKNNGVRLKTIEE